MVVAMVDIREVRVRMNQHLVPMWMPMRLVTVPLEIVLVSMMRVVHMRMIVFVDVVPVFMLVTFGDMEPDTHTHQHCGDAELHGHRFVLHRDG